MRDKVVSGILLILLLTAMSTLLFDTKLAEADGAVTLETDKNVYFLGENVVITFTNLGNESVSLGSWPSLRIYKYWELNFTTELVFPKVWAFYLVELDPGENYTLVWNQYNAFTEAPAGYGTFYVQPLRFGSLRVFFYMAIPGDVDLDKDVDVGDQRKVQLAMFSVPGEPHWNPNMDVDRDLDVDVGDQRIQQNHMFESVQQQ